MVVTEDPNPVDIRAKIRLTNKIANSSKSYSSFGEFIENYSPGFFNDGIDEKIESLCYFEKGKGALTLKKYNLKNVILEKAISKRSFFNRTFVKDMIGEIDGEINSFFRSYKFSREKGLNHSESISNATKVKRSLIKTFEEADFVTEFGPNYLNCKEVPRIFDVWDCDKYDKKDVSEFINTSFSKNYHGISKMKIYDFMLVEIAEKFGRKMSLSTMYRHLDKSFKKKRNSAFIEKKPLKLFEEIKTERLETKVA
jgi:hypothetical protein